jgi:hypothetical protein
MAAGRSPDFVPRWPTLLSQPGASQWKTAGPAPGVVLTVARLCGSFTRFPFHSGPWGKQPKTVRWLIVKIEAALNRCKSSAYFRRRRANFFPRRVG